MWRLFQLFIFSFPIPAALVVSRAQKEGKKERKGDKGEGVCLFLPVSLVGVGYQHSFSVSLRTVAACSGVVSTGECVVVVFSLLRIKEPLAARQ